MDITTSFVWGIIGYISIVMLVLIMILNSGSVESFFVTKEWDSKRKDSKSLAGKPMNVQDST
jgi:hypothetical protein